MPPSQLNTVLNLLKFPYAKHPVSLKDLSFYTPHLNVNNIWLAFYIPYVYIYGNIYIKDCIVYNIVQTVNSASVVDVKVTVMTHLPPLPAKMI